MILNYKLIADNFLWAGLGQFYIALIFIIISLILIIWGYSNKSKIVTLLGPVSGKFKAWKNFSYLREKIKSILLLFSLILLAIVIARPQIKEETKTGKSEVRDLIIVLDISRSMLAQDIKPNRLEVAKQKIHEIVDMLPAYHLGLILFSGDAFVQVPITKDKDTFFSFLKDVDVETISSGTTNVAVALEKAINQLKKIDNASTKTIVLITDGEDFSEDASQVLANIRKDNLTVLTLGVGTITGAPIPIYNGQKKIEGYQKDRAGNIVITKLGEDFLYNLSKESGGLYAQVTSDTSDVQKIVNQLNRLSKKREVVEKNISVQEKYHLFGFLSLIFLLIMLLI